jgi:hypothetical protein
MTTPFEKFLQELAKVLHFPQLAPDAHGVCLIIMKEGNIPLLFEFDDHLVPNTILLSSPIIHFAIDHRVEIYKASLIGNTTIEETLSVKPDEDLLYLHRRFHPDIGSSDLETLLQTFLDIAKKWRGKVEQILSQPPQEKTSHRPTIQVFPYKV